MELSARPWPMRARLDPKKSLGSFFFSLPPSSLSLNFFYLFQPPRPLTTLLRCTASPSSLSSLRPPPSWSTPRAGGPPLVRSLLIMLILVLTPAPQAPTRSPGRESRNIRVLCFRVALTFVVSFQLGRHRSHDLRCRARQLGHYLPSDSHLPHRQRDHERRVLQCHAVGL